MALLNQSQAYVDPRASVLYGSGNSKITPTEIKQFITSPGRSDKDVLGAALANNVSTSQIASAMKGNPNYTPEKINAYLASQGISQDKKESPYEYQPITYNPISNVEATQDPVKGTVAGQLNNVLDPNSPLMQRAATIGSSMANKRGLLNSSIGVSAAMAPMIDAGLQIATPDAASNNQFKLFNANSANETNRFNASNLLSSNVANAGNLKDYASMQNQLDIANLDVNTKLKIANIDALSKDSSIAASLNQSLMDAIVKINSQDKPVEVRQAEIGQLVDLTTKSIGLLQAFESKVPSLDFSDIKRNSNGALPGANDQGTSGATGASGASGGKSSVMPVKDLNILNYDVEPYTMQNVITFERQTGQKVDRSRIVPERLIRDIGAASNKGRDDFYLGSDGLTHQANGYAYDVPGLMKATGANNLNEMFNKLFAPVYVPGTGRADQIMFYVYR